MFSVCQLFLHDEAIEEVFQNSREQEKKKKLEKQVFASKTECSYKVDPHVA